KQGDHVGEQVVGRQYRVVVAVHHLFATAVAEVVAVAGGTEASQVQRRAGVVGRTVVPELVQHDHLVAGDAVDRGIQPVEQDPVVAPVRGAVGTGRGGTHGVDLQAGADALA